MELFQWPQLNQKVCEEFAAQLNDIRGFRLDEVVLRERCGSCGGMDDHRSIS